MVKLPSWDYNSIRQDIRANFLIPTVSFYPGLWTHPFSETLSLCRCSTRKDVASKCNAKWKREWSLNLFNKLIDISLIMEGSPKSIRDIIIMRATTDSIKDPLICSLKWLKDRIRHWDWFEISPGPADVGEVTYLGGLV